MVQDQVAADRNGGVQNSRIRSPPPSGACAGGGGSAAVGGGRWTRRRHRRRAPRRARRDCITRSPRSPSVQPRAAWREDPNNRSGLRCDDHLELIAAACVATILWNSTAASSCSRCHRAPRSAARRLPLSRSECPTWSWARWLQCCASLQQHQRTEKCC